ncbi:Zinc finger protein 64-like protein [Armadillidium nasatum]|uniref:Zinc finger protein 64-like protein n=1 Tax=Armadillidium nasatum TaxID=96803 RepID=A0A5N5SVA5_9CRUS|nr:Zinc finger protein 64-like protein [Armadillidium nasatum]
MQKITPYNSLYFSLNFINQRDICSLIASYNSFSEHPDTQFVRRRLGERFLHMLSTITWVDFALRYHRCFARSTSKTIFNNLTLLPFRIPMVLGTVTSARQFKEGQSDKIESVRDPFASTCYPHLMLSEEQHHYSNYLEEGKGFACLLCRHVATTKGSLRRHMRRHTGERPYRCQFCPYGASQKSDLDKHIRNNIILIDILIGIFCGTDDDSHLRPRVHVPILPFSWSCSDNSALFDTPSRDMLFEQTFQCLLCSDHLSTKGSLARHMRKHTGERPFKCQICPYAAIQKSDLDRHIRRKHFNKDFLIF